MSNVIDFLERMGQDASLRHADGRELERAMNDAQIDVALRAAIVNHDQQSLGSLLGATNNVCSIVFPVDEDHRQTVSDTQSQRQA